MKVRHRPNPPRMRLPLTPGLARAGGQRPRRVQGVEPKSVIYAAQGSIQNPKMDAEGKPLAEAVGTALYGGTWTSSAYDGNTSLTLNLNCESAISRRCDPISRRSAERRGSTRQ